MLVFAVIWAVIFLRIEPSDVAHPPQRRRGAERGEPGARALKVLVVSGIWPPDVGGPASHAPDVAAFLRERGHDVEVVVTADAPAAPSLPRALDLAIAAQGRRAMPSRRRVIAARARRPTSSTRRACSARTALACALAPRPLVVKLTADPAFERARWRGLVGGDVDAFQHGGGGSRLRCCAALRDVDAPRAPRTS